MKRTKFEIRPGDHRVQNHPFKFYRNLTMRRAERYLPSENEPDAIPINTPWGEQLTCRKGDYIVREIGDSGDSWPVSADIFEKTYVEIEPGYYIKRAVVELAPLTEFTGYNPDALVVVHTMEGVVRVRSGDFYLARGVEGEIWPIPIEKVEQTMIPVEDENEGEGETSQVS